MVIKYLQNWIKHLSLIGLLVLLPQQALPMIQNIEQASDASISRIEPLFLNTIVNNKNLDLVSIYYYDSVSNSLYADKNTILNWGVAKLPKKLTTKQIHGKEYYAISSLIDVSYKVNQQALSVKILVPSTYFNKNNLELGNRDLILKNDATQTYGAFLNYYTNSLYGETQNYTNNAYSTLGLFTPYGTFSQSVLVQPRNINKLSSPNQEDIVWLNTQWRFDDKDNLTTYIIGDSTTTAQSWTGSAAFFGVNVYKNYSINPNIITFPQPNIIGNSALPSTIELLVNNVPVSTQELNSGEFEFNNVPVLTGTGTIAVQSTNILGETTVTYVPYFTSPLLLAEGLDNYSFEAGLLRNNFGTKSFDYGQALFVGTYSRGLTDKWTSSMHGEFLKEQQSMGLIQTLAIGSGDASLAIAGSHKVGNKYGGLVSLSYQYSLGVNVGGSVTTSSSNFTNLGLVNTTIKPPTYTAQAFISYVLPSNNRISINYFRSKLRPSEDDTDFMNDEINIGYDVTLFDRLNLSVNALADLQNGSNWQLLASLQYIFDDDKNNISVNNSYQDGQERYGMALQGSTTSQKHGVDYNLSVNRQSSSEIDSSASGSITLKNQYGNFSTTASASDQQKNLSVRLDGGIVFMDGGLYFTEPVRTSVVLVETPELPGTKVYYNNQPAGNTDSHGKILIPNLSPFSNNKLAISPVSIPLDTTIQSSNLNVVPGYLTANHVPFKIQKVKSTVIEFINDEGNPLPLGSQAVMKQLGKNNPYLIGYGGILYLTDIPKNITTLHGKIYYGRLVCEFNVNLPSGYQNSVHEKTACIPVKSIS